MGRREELEKKIKDHEAEIAEFKKELEVLPPEQLIGRVGDTYRYHSEKPNRMIVSWDGRYSIVCLPEDRSNAGVLALSPKSDLQTLLRYARDMGYIKC